MPKACLVVMKSHRHLGFTPMELTTFSIIHTITKEVLVY